MKNSYIPKALRVYTGRITHNAPYDVPKTFGFVKGSFPFKQQNRISHSPQMFITASVLKASPSIHS